MTLAAGEAMRGRAPFDEALIVVVSAYLPIRTSWSKRKQAAARDGMLHATTKPDGDNYLKAALDGLNTIVWRDDSLIVDMRVRKLYSDKPRLVIEVEPAAFRLQAVA